MIQQGIAERQNLKGGLDEHCAEMVQESYLKGNNYAIEARVYCENPADEFRPCPGVLQFVDLAEDESEGWLRVDHWVSFTVLVMTKFDGL
jgi:acetyl/propionyl-CoA carboxylase alpha subunit